MRISSRKRNALIRWGILVVAIGFIGMGIYQGEQLEVLAKAIRICLECIGIG